MDGDALGELLARQDGVVSRRQLREMGIGKAALDRMLRRRELARVHRGVFVDHTGPLTDRQRAWAAVLCAAPAALCLESAIDPGHVPVHVAVAEARRVTPPPGVQVHRMVGLDERVCWNLSPPRLRVEENTLELLERAKTVLDVVRVLTAAVGGRSTTVPRLREAILGRRRLRRRRLIVRLLTDLEAGTHSVLEHGYLVRVERAHGLPRPDRQATRRTDTGHELRDVDYAAYGLVVELDGRTGHEGWDATGRDADRDLDDHASGRESVRLRYHQVFRTPCRTAERLVRILRRRGWAGPPQACGPGCVVGRA